MSEIKVTVVKYPDRKQLMLRYTDLVTGIHKAKSARTTNRREAERAAAKWEAELQEGRYQPTVRTTWAEFRERYEDEKLASLSPNTAETAATTFNHVEKLINPKNLQVLDATILSRFQAALRKTGIKETSIATHLRHLRAALSWAVAMQLLPVRPDIQMPKRARGRSLMRGRPITAEEFDRFLATVPKVREKDAESWQFYLRGLWLSGLRLEESTILSWDLDAPITVDFKGRRPRLRIYAEAEKGHQDRLLPMTPDFAQFLLTVPREEREGLIFKLPNPAGKQMTAKRACRIISDIGRKAGVVVNKAENKFATAHDLRRSFGTRWASRVKPATLQLLMRHRSIETTLKYYVEQDADEVADELWRNFSADADPAAQNSSQQQPAK